MNTQIGIFHNEKEIDRWLLTQDKSHIMAWDYSLIGHAPYIFTDHTNEVLTRYNLLKNYQVYSFSQNFDDLPAWWIETISLIDTEMQKAIEDKKKHGN